MTTPRRRASSASASTSNGQAKELLFHYNEVFYTPQRRHLALAYKPTMKDDRKRLMPTPS